MSGTRTWVEGNVGYLEARFRADKSGIRDAQNSERNLLQKGFQVVDISHDGGGLNVTRSAVKSIFGLGMLGLTGLGFAGTSHDPGNIVVTFAKRFDLEPDADAGRQPAVATQTWALRQVVRQHPELASHPDSDVSVESAIPVEGGHGHGAELHLVVTNRSGRDWFGFELEAIFHDRQTGESVDGASQRFQQSLYAGQSVGVTMTANALAAGDFGILVGVTRVLIETEWV